MLTLTKKTDYALVALSYLARRTGDIVSARELARLSRVPLPILTNILKTLAGAEIVVSERGSSGGYGLARPATEINLHSLITVIEGPIQFVHCAVTAAASGKTRCELVPRCPVRLPVRRIHSRLQEFLKSVTLAELFADEEEPAGEHSADDEEGTDSYKTVAREIAE